MMVANEDDGRVNFSQGIEFFTALRRLGKISWMLSYPNQGHGLYGNARIDYVMRSTQFFDHYLKDEAAPRWMFENYESASQNVNNPFGYVLKKDPVTKRWVTPQKNPLFNESQIKEIISLEQRQSLQVEIK